MTQTFNTASDSKGALQTDGTTAANNNYPKAKLPNYSASPDLSSPVVDTPTNFNQQSPATTLNDETLKSIGNTTNESTAATLKIPAKPSRQTAEDPSPFYENPIFWGLLLAVIPVVYLLSTLFRTGEPNYNKPVKRAQPIPDDPDESLKGRFKKTERFKIRKPAPAEAATPTAATDAEIIDQSNNHVATTTYAPAEIDADVSELPTMHEDHPADDEFEFDVDLNVSDSDMFDEDEAKEIVSGIQPPGSGGSSKRFKTEDDITDITENISADVEQDDSDAEFGFDIEDNDFFDDEISAVDKSAVQSDSVAEPIAVDSAVNDLAEFNKTKDKEFGPIPSDLETDAECLTDSVKTELAMTSQTAAKSAAKGGSLVSRMFGRGKNAKQLKSDDSTAATIDSMGLTPDVADAPTPVLANDDSDEFEFNFDDDERPSVPTNDSAATEHASPLAKPTSDAITATNDLPDTNYSIVIEALEADKLQLTDQADWANALADDLTTQLEQHLATNQTLESELADTKAELERAQLSIQSTNDQQGTDQDARQTRLEDLTAERDALTAEVTSLTSQGDSLGAEQKTLQTQIQDLQATVEKQAAEIAAQEATPSPVSVPAVAQTKSDECIKNLKLRFKKRLSQEQRKCIVAQDQLAEAEEQRSEIARQLKTSRNELAATQEQQPSSDASDDDEFALVDSPTAAPEVEKLKQEIEALNKRIKKAELRADAKMAVVEKLKSQLVEKDAQS